MPLSFSASARALLAALDAARAATPSAPSLTAYAGVLLQAEGKLLTITGADGEVQIEALVHLAEPAASGSVLIAPAPLAALLRSVNPSSEVALRHHQDLEVAVSGLRPYQLRTIHATLPQSTKPAAEEVAVSLPGLKSALTAVRPAAGRELGGVQLVTDGEQLHLRATDTYRLHAASIPAPGLPAFQGVVPLAVLARVCEINPTHMALDAHARVLMARSSDVRITSRLLATPFPNVDSILAAQPPRTLLLESQALVTALGRLQSIADSAPVFIVAKDGTATLTASNVELGTGAEEVSAVGDPLEVALARQFLQDAVTAVQAPTVSLGYSGPNQALLVAASPQNGVRCVVMPVRQ
jgi:DNA polymerase-3 subunit beta